MNELLVATNTLLTLLGTASNFMVQATQVSELIQKANSEGRTTFTPEEWAVITAADDAARKTLSDAINSAAPAT